LLHKPVRENLESYLLGCRQASLAGLEEFFAPGVVEIGADALVAAELSDGLLISKAFEDDVNLLLGVVFAPGPAADLSDLRFGITTASPRHETLLWFLQE
jgi:hypothetical protein